MCATAHQTLKPLDIRFTLNIALPPPPHPPTHPAGARHPTTRSDDLNSFF